jgi:D-beta-D-heptose 7-phosphate kinase/D-beta-D-heptose 1-phosphate adenosyltransferase
MKIIVIGELCLDRFIYVETKRLSPEAPVPILTPIEMTENKGMSGNVVENLKSLNKDLHIIHWYQDKDITKTRYVDKKSNHMFLRVDEGETDIKPLELNTSKLNELKNVDAVIISDYNKGFLNDELLFEITKHTQFSIIDTKKQIGDDLINKFDFVKLNESEFSKHNLNGNSINKLLITLGSNGAKYRDKIYPSPNPKETIDVSGAGDTFTSSFTLKYLETKDVEESIIFANKMASIVVSKRGVTTPTIQFGDGVK